VRAHSLFQVRLELLHKLCFQHKVRLHRWQPSVTSVFLCLTTFCRRPLSAVFNFAFAARKTGQAIIERLMATDLVPVEESKNGMRVLKGVMDLRDGGTVDVIVRSVTEPFFRECIKLTKGHRVSAAGNPGIGKSISTCYLVKLILASQPCTVVYLHRSLDHSGYYYEFTSSCSADGTPHVECTQAYPESQSPAHIPSLLDPNNFYVVDPGKTKDSCDPSDVVTASVIMVPSLDNRHWNGNEFVKGHHKGHGGVIVCNSIWSLEELLAAQPYMFPDLTTDDILEGCRIFGYVPRLIAAMKDPARLKSFLDHQDRAIKSLSERQVRAIVLGQIKTLDSYDQSQPSCYVMGCSNQPPFHTPSISIISPVVAEKISVLFAKDLWGVIVSEHHSSKAGLLFEPLVRHQFLTENEYQCSEAGPAAVVCSKDDPEISCLLGKPTSKKPRAVSSMKFGGCSGIRLVVDPIASVRAGQDGVLYHSSNSSNYGIDFIYKFGARYTACNPTVGKTHDLANVEYLKERLQLQDHEHLDLLYNVPLDHMAKFTTSPVKPTPVKNFRVWIMGIPKPDEEISPLTLE
jgi:hypothetical protein